MTIWVIKDGLREGPYDEQDVRELIYEGTYGDTDPAIVDGQADWTTLGEILDNAPDRGAYPAIRGDVNPEELPPRIPGLPKAERPERAEKAERTTAAKARTRNGTNGVKPQAYQYPRVTVADIEMPFGSMVIFLIKWALAAIPALLILGVIAAMLLFGLGVIAAAIGQ